MMWLSEYPILNFIAMQLWNASVVFAATFPIAVLLRKWSPGLAYWFSWIPVAVLCIPHTWIAALRPSLAIEPDVAILGIQMTGQVFDNASLNGLTPYKSNALTGILLMAWGLVSSGLLLINIRQRKRVINTILHDARLCEQSRITTCLDRWRTEFRIRRPVEVYQSQAGTPCTFGSRHPRIIIPESIATSLTDTQLCAVIAHELAHIKRNDDAQLQVILCLKAIFFFFPPIYACQWLQRECREYLCDQLVLVPKRMTAADYASALVSVAAQSRSPGQHQLLQAGAFKGLKARVHFIHSPRARKTPSFWMYVGGILATTLTVSPWFARAEHSDTTPNFIAPVQDGRITSRFGLRKNPTTKSDTRQQHRGVDIANKTGTAIYAVAAGTVVRAGQNDPVAGNYLIVQHAGHWQSTYTHLNTLSVEQDDRLFQGQQIATMGSTGRATGPHLHFELSKSGEPQNPLHYFWTQTD